MNPLAEFRRNLWLELTPQRLIAAPLVILVLVLLIQAAEGWDPAALANLGNWVFYGFVFLWGSRRAAAAVSEEVNGDTWTGQRLSALSPAALVFGKLFGATAFIWYGGLIGLGLFLVGSLAGGAAPGPVLLDAAQRLASGVFLHAVAIATSLALLNKRGLVTRLGTTLPQLLALGAALLLLGSFARVSFVSSFSFWGYDVAWYGWRFGWSGFLAATCVVFAGWAALACLRLMAVQLQRQVLPWAWPAFVLFCMAFAQGFVQESGPELPWFGPLLAPFGLVLAFFYLALFAERNEPLRYHRCALAFRAGDLRRALSLLPWWAVTWPILLALALWRGAETPPLSSGLWRDLWTGGLSAPPDALLANLGFAAFALRDAAFVVWMNAGGGRRADLVAWIYLVVLYGPLLGALMGAKAFTLAGLLTPLPLDDSPLPLVSALLQALLLAWLARRRWLRLFSA